MPSYSLQKIGDYSSNSGTLVQTANKWDIKNPNANSYRWIDVFSINPKAVKTGNNVKFTISAYVKSVADTQIGNWSEDPNNGKISYLKIRFYSDSARKNPIELVNDGSATPGVQALSGSFVSSTGGTDIHTVTASAIAKVTVTKVYVTVELDCDGMNNHQGLLYEVYNKYIHNMYEYGVFDVSDLLEAPVLKSISIDSLTSNSLTIKADITKRGIPESTVSYSLNGGTPKNVSLSSDNTFTITGLNPYTKYDISVTLSNSLGYSTKSTSGITAAVEPSISLISNGNKLNENDAKSASSSSITITSNSINWGTPSGTLNWSCGSKTGTLTSGNTFTITGLDQNTEYTITAWMTSSAFPNIQFPIANKPSIKIRTKGGTPQVNLAFSSRTLTSLVFTWSSSISLKSTEYKLDSGQWTNLGQTGTSGTITISNLAINSAHAISFRGIGNSEDNVSSNEVSASGTTYDIARISEKIEDDSAKDQIFGTGTFKVKVTNPSGSSATLKVWITGNNLTRTFTKNLTAAGDYEFSLTQDDWDNIYKCFSNTQNINTLPLYYQITTNSGSITYDDTRKDRTLTLTGIAKTANIKPSGQTAVKRCQCWIKVNGVNRRAVAWINVKGQGIKRCI